jgi:branched-subunit amino acid transport protein
MDQKLILATILGMAAVTYLPRLFPLLALSGKKLPEFLVSWLRYVPAAVLAAMLMPALLIFNNELTISIDNLYFWAAIPTFAAAIRTKNLYVPVLLGMAFVILGRLLL